MVLIYVSQERDAMIYVAFVIGLFFIVQIVREDLADGYDLVESEFM